MELRGKEELHLQHLLNNLGHNLLQFSTRMTDLIVSGSPELSLIARTQLMTSLGLLPMNTMELCQAWDQFEYAYKSTGIPWPDDFEVAFPKKHEYVSHAEDKVIGKKRGEGTQTQENQTKTHRRHGDTTPFGTLAGPLVGTLARTLDGIQKRHLRKIITIFPKRRRTMTSPSRTPVSLLEGTRLETAAVEPDLLYVLDSLYAFYHSLWWCYRQRYFHFKWLHASLNA